MGEITLPTTVKRTWNKIQINWKGYLISILLGVPLVGGGILMFLPLIWTVSFSFGLPQEFFELPPPIIPSALRLDNYRAVLERVDFLTFFKNSVIVSASVVVGQIITCSMAAYAFARLRFPGRNFIFAMFLASMMVPGQVTLIPNFIIIREMGLYNSLGALIVPGLTNIFGVFLLRQFFETIPDELEDAAKIDGAGFFQIYWKIMFPLVLPAVATLSILTFNSTWNAFFGPLIFINSQSKMTLPLGMMFLSNQTGVMSSGIIMAAVVLNLVPVLLVFLIFQRRLVEGITMTGLKGI
jgi:multiple sugar transport system permease protein